MLDYNFDWEGSTGFDHVKIDLTIDINKLEDTYNANVKPTRIHIPDPLDIETKLNPKQKEKDQEEAAVLFERLWDQHYNHKYYPDTSTIHKQKYNSIYLFIDLPMSVSIYPPICPSVYISMNRSVYLFV